MSRTKHIPFEDCDCLNCRLTRIENSLEEIKVILENSPPKPVKTRDIKIQKTQNIRSLPNKIR